MMDSHTYFTLCVSMLRFVGMFFVSAVVHV